ncbi:hypothetical protein [Leeuwenhoekiella sp. H156]|uniref:hypothetical protein n=1 Tax=Leeuwenhoekiella sp. H156 TaxID=3450128 RepID=UPI003FA42A47
MNFLKFLFLFIPLFAIAQGDNATNAKLQLRLSYGLALIDYGKDFTQDYPDLSFSNIGTLINLEADLPLSKNRFIGLGFSKQIHSKNINQSNLGQTSGRGLILDNYRLTHLKNYYDIHFRKKFQNRLELTFGVFYYNEYYNEINLDNIQNESVYILFNDEQRDDNFGVSLSLGYFFKINQTLDLGIVGRLGYSLNGLEHIALLPSVNLKF